jgi:hypothetical protein
MPIRVQESYELLSSHDRHRIIKHALVFAAVCNNRIPEVPLFDNGDRRVSNLGLPTSQGTSALLRRHDTLTVRWIQAQMPIH